MGVYIEGLESPKTGSIRIQLYDDGIVWIFQGFGWERQENTYTDLDLVRCKDCKHSKNCIYPAKWNWCPDGERRTDERTD